MTDNEKRAHDLAIAVCVGTAIAKINCGISSGKTEIKIDHFQEYMNAYNVALDSFNKAFPDGNN